MRLFLVVTLTSTLFYSMTGLVYSEGGFAGALVVKPYPMYPVLFGGGEQGTWARHHPGEPLPWFMQKDLRVIAPFDWEYGEPTGVTIYMFGFLATLLTWVVLTIIGAVKVLREPRGESGLCLHVIRLPNQSQVGYLEREGNVYFLPSTWKGQTTRLFEKSGLILRNGY